MDSQLVVLSFDSSDDAERAAADLRALAAQGFVALEDGAVLAKGDDGALTVKGFERYDVAAGAGVGGVIGLLAGGLLGLPVIGLLAGAGVGVNRADTGERLEELLGSVARDMTAGSAVVAVLVSSVDDPDVVRDRLEVDAVRSIEIPAELRDHIESQRERGS